MKDSKWGFTSDPYYKPINFCEDMWIFRFTYCNKSFCCYCLVKSTLNYRCQRSLQMLVSFKGENASSV